MSIEDKFISNLVDILYPNLEEVRCYEEGAARNAANDRRNGSPIFNREELEAEISRLGLFKKRDGKEDVDIISYFEDSYKLLNSGLLTEKMSESIENIFDNDIFCHRDINPFEQELFRAGLFSALNLGLKIGRIEGEKIAFAIAFKNQKISSKTYSETQFIKMSSSLIGSRKNLKQREASHLYLSKVLDDTPDISINKIAKMLNHESKSNRIEFSREVPVSTAKDYARQVKKQNEDQQ
jgi:hypothetical protein